MKRKIEEAQEQRDEVRALLAAMERLSHADGTLSCQTDLGIAYNNTFVDKVSELIPCVQLRHSKEYDVALVQLKQKQTPAHCYIFDVELPTDANNEPLPDKNGMPIDLDHMPLGAPLYMIGFNKGLLIGKTKEGIKAQVTTGTLSQEVDNVEIMYTIPALGGSSGSPVLNEYGDLVAINHAGWQQTQGFNYGIKVKHLRDLVHQNK